MVSRDEDKVSKMVIVREPSEGCYKVLVYARVWIVIGSFRRLSDARSYFPKAQRKIGHVNNGAQSNGHQQHQGADVSESDIHEGRIEPSAAGRID